MTTRTRAVRKADKGVRKNGHVKKTHEDKVKELAAKRAQRCHEEVQKILERYSCDISSIPYLTQDGRIAAHAMISPK